MLAGLLGRPGGDDAEAGDEHGCDAVTTSRDKAAYQRQRRQERYRKRDLIQGRMTAPLPPEHHGKAGTYTNHGCRCPRCRNAFNAARRGANERRRQRLAHLSRSPGPAEPSSPPGNVDPGMKPEIMGRTAGERPQPGDETPVPPFTGDAAEQIMCLAHLARIKHAYYWPQAVTPVPGKPETERRFHTGCAITVTNGTIVRIGLHE